jgi:hypothetical protein
MSNQPIGSDRALQNRRNTAAGKAKGTKGLPVALPDGNVQMPNGTILTPTDGTKFFEAKLQLLGTTSVTGDFSADVTKFKAGLFQNDPSAIRMKNLLISSGVVSAKSSLSTIASAYEDALEEQAAFKKNNYNFSLEEIIQNTGQFQTRIGEGGPTVSAVKVDYGMAEVGDKSQGAKQARLDIKDYFTKFVGIQPDINQIEEMRLALVRAAAKAIPTTTTTREGGKVVTKTTPGFDISSWAQGYLANKFSGQDVDGQIGQAQDQIKLLERAYGIDMGSAWRANAVNAIGKGALVTDFEDDLRATAVSKFPALSDRLNKGERTISIASPYIKAKANLFEIDENTIDLNDSDIQMSLNAQNEQGQFTTKPIWQFEKDLRKKPEWQTTKNAKEEYDSVMLRVLRDMGLMG